MNRTDKAITGYTGMDCETKCAEGVVVINRDYLREVLSHATDVIIQDWIREATFKASDAELCEVLRVSVFATHDYVLSDMLVYILNEDVNEMREKVGSLCWSVFYGTFRGDIRDKVFDLLEIF